MGSNARSGSAFGALLALLAACAQPPETPPHPPPASASASTRVAAAPPPPAPDLPVEIAAGALHTCARTARGAVYCWGDNRYGELGDGTTDVRTTPTRVAGLEAALAIAAAGEQTCALLASGTYCWGKSPQPEERDPARPGFVVVRGGRAAAQLTPQRMKLDAAVALALGSEHGCARHADGAVRCWGGNTYGEAGTTPGPLVVAEPVRVAPVSGALELRAGVAQTCARTTAEVWCWGHRDSRADAPPAPVAPVAGLGGDVAELALGMFSGCARLTDGGVSSWHDSEPPARKAALAGVRLVAGAEDRYCAVDRAGETVCWLERFGWLHFEGVARAPSLDGAVSLALGRFHACALRGDGTIACSGENALGQRGGGTRGDAFTALGVGALRGLKHLEIDGDTTFGVGADRQIASLRGGALSRVSGSAGTTAIAARCALVDTGRVACWNHENRFEPVPGIEHARSLAGEMGAHCAGLEDGSVRCWGRRGGVSAHALFAPQPDDSWRGAPPRTIQGLNDVEEVALGGTFGCARRRDGSVWCWQREDNDRAWPTPGTRPLPVGGIAGAIQLSAMSNRAACTLADGSVVTFEPGTSEAPALVAGIGDALEVRLGVGHACARRRDGTVLCWGFIGTLDNRAFDAPTPVAVAGLRGAVELAVGNEHDCARLENGDVACWGMNRRGELGVFPGEETPVTIVRF